MKRTLEVLDGSVVNPNLHDADILGMMLKGEDLVLTVRLVDGVLIDLIFHKVYRLIANGFREGNVVLDFEITTAEDIVIEDVQVFYASKTNDSASFLCVKAKSENKIVAKISSSYGCEIACLCDAVLL